MSPDIETLVLEHLVAIHRTADRLAEDIRYIKARLGIIESQIGILTDQYAVISNPLDRMDERILRIEQRLDLIKA